MLPAVACCDKNDWNVACVNPLGAFSCGWFRGSTLVLPPRTNSGPVTIRAPRRALERRLLQPRQSSGLSGGNRRQTYPPAELTPRREPSLMTHLSHAVPRPPNPPLHPPSPQPLPTSSTRAPPPLPPPERDETLHEQPVNAPPGEALRLCVNAPHVESPATHKSRTFTCTVHVPY